MKYTIDGFNQAEVVASGMDAADVVLLRWLTDFAATGRMKHVEVEGRVFYWVQYGTVLQELPIIGTENKDVLARRLRRMTEAGILIHTHVMNGGSYSYFGFGPRFQALISSPPPPTPESDPLRLKSRTPPTPEPDPSDTGVGAKIPLQDSSTRDSGRRLRRLPATATNKGRPLLPPIVFDWTEGKFENLSNEEVERWQDTYPAVDVEQKIGALAVWLVGNPTQRKKNYRRFLTNNLSRDQEKGGGKWSRSR